MSTHSHVLQDLDALTQHVAQDLAALVPRGKTPRPFSLALCGGSTPKKLFSVLAQKYRDAIAWEQLHIFWSDERCVPPDHADSNYGAAKALLLDHVPVPPAQIYRMPADLEDREAAAAQYASTLQSHFKCAPDEVPAFNLMLLGMGTDGHTASLFPGHAALREHDRLVVAVHEPKVAPPWRLSVTMPVIIGARHVWFMVAGADKASLVRSILKPSRGSAERYPAARANISVREPVWYLDRAAHGSAAAPVDAT
jgi:6-phosphogluconolactonase